MTRAPVPPFVHTLLCGRRLVALRLRTELTQSDIARQCGWKQNKVARVELGEQRIEADDLDKLLALLDPSEEERLKIVAHAEEGHKQVPRGELRWRFRREMQKVVDLEGSAPRSFAHGAMAVPGLTQTEDYIANFARAYRPVQSVAEIDELVATRLARQKFLDNLDQHFEFVIDEAALARMQNMGGSSEVRHHQLLKLAELADRPNVTITFVPFTHGPYHGQEHDFGLFEYDIEPGQSTVTVGYADYTGALTVFHDDHRVGWHRGLSAEQRRVALSPERSRWFLSLLTGGDV